MSQFVNLFVKKQPYDLKNLMSILDDATTSSNKENFLTKTGFSASVIGYGSGTCPRRWVLAFNGANFIDNHSASSIDNMASGTDRHERIQKIFEDSNLNVEIEHEFFVTDPPMHGFVDLILKDFNGYNIVIEIKTTRTESFEYKKINNKGADYQELQLLIYLYILEEKYGLLLYENKNDHSKLMIPVVMDEHNKLKVEKVFEWMRLVHKTFTDGNLPVKPFRKNSKICSSCPLKEWCFSKEEGNINIPVLEY